MKTYPHRSKESAVLACHQIQSLTAWAQRCFMNFSPTAQPPLTSETDFITKSCGK